MDAVADCHPRDLLCGEDDYRTVWKIFQPFQLSEAEEGIQHLDLYEQPELCWKRDGGI